MPEPKLTIDKDGYVLEGRFAGRHISTVMAYAESLEAAAADGGTPPAAPKGKTPEERLEEHASGRVDAAAAMTAQRLEADDLSAFRARIGEDEYAKYKDAISGVLKQMPLAQRVMKDVHWTIYVQLKARDPEFTGFAPAKPPPKEKEETDAEREAREAREAKEEEERLATEAAAAAPPPAGKPPAPQAAPPRKATPPTAPPSPSSRAAAPKERKPKLVANEKIRRAAREWGITEEAYLLQLEDRGMTQDDIERQTAPREDTRRKSVFDRPTAR